MAENLILQTEGELPADVRALLHAPPPDGVWHVASHPRTGNPFRIAAAITLVLLVAALILFTVTNADAWRPRSFRSERFFITLGPVLLAGGLYSLSRRAKAKAERSEADAQAGRVRFGVWLTTQHLLVHDYEGICCACRADIAETHVYHAGGGRPTLLVLTLRGGQRIRIIVAALNGWAGRAEELRAEFERRRAVNPGVTAEEMRHWAEFYLPHKNFPGFIRVLDDKAQQLKSGTLEKAALLAMADATLAAWPDKARSPLNEWFMLTETDGTWEYGVNNAYSGGGTAYLGCKMGSAHWLLPLCRAVHFEEAESIFPSAASVEDCATTFRDVPLTMIEFTGGMDAAVFDAFLAWAATKPLKTLTARRYNPERNSRQQPDDDLFKKLAAFKQQRQIA